jgi:acyl-homoserine-lactone acylase
MKRIIGGFAIALLGLAIGAGVYLWHPLARNPDAATLRAAAASYDAEIIRDGYGVPHIYGARDADTAFGLAYAHAEDDFETIQETVAAARGHLARYRGAGAAPVDYIVSLLAVWPTVRRRYAADVPADVKAMAEAYAAGLNLYAAEHPQATWAGLAPFTGEDVVAGFIFKTPFFYGLDDTLLALFGKDHTQTIALDPAAGREAFLLAPKSMAERGSNAFAVAPTRSGDGMTRLMINSHQPLSGPVAWYEAHVVSGEGLDITGGLFPGTPVILHGFNKSVGWANTVSAQDLVDVYALEINPANKNQYRLDGAWRDFEVTTARIDVRLAGPFAFPARRAVKRSVHGPVIEAKHGTYAVRYAGMGEIRQLEQYYRLGKADGMGGFMTAMAMNALPSINYIAADKAGNIAFVHNAQYPDRNDAWDWSAEMPGNRSDLIWQGYHPFTAIPMLVNPASGLVWNSNNTPFSATDGPHNLKREDFPQSMGLQDNQTNRALRMMELTGDTDPIGEARLLAMKFDSVYAQDSEAHAVVKAVLATDWSQEPALAAAAAHLAAWDLSTEATSRHAALGSLTTNRAITAKYTKIPAPPPEVAFREAAAWLMQHHGRIDPEWGDVNRLVRGGVNLPISGGPDILRAVYPQALREDGEIHMTAGDTWIALVEWDAAGQQRARVISPYGSASLDATSPHYADQAPLFAGEQWREALLTRAAIEADATRRYRPGKD